MRDGTGGNNISDLDGQSISDAKWHANFYVRSHLHAARAAQAKGDRPKAMENLGQAMHTLQDSTSPMHHGFKAWYDYPAGTADAREWYHGAGELLNPGTGSWLYQATRQAYDYFNTSAALPSDFFGYLGSDSRVSQMKATVRRKYKSFMEAGSRIFNDGFGEIGVYSRGY